MTISSLEKKSLQELIVVPCMIIDSLFMVKVCDYINIVVPCMIIDSLFMVKVCDYIIVGKKIPSRIDSSALYDHLNVCWVVSSVEDN